MCATALWACLSARRTVKGALRWVGGAARMRESGTPFICFPRFLKRCEEWLMSSAIVCQVLLSALCSWFDSVRWVLSLFHSRVRKQASGG